MLGRLDGAFRTERALVEDVSHELRNPVAVIQANVEAVLGNEDVDAAPSAARPPGSSPAPPAGCRR